MQDIETIRSRVQKLLAVAANEAATPGEKSNAMRMASALMRRYNIERHEVEDTREEYGSVEIETLWTRLTPWESTLANFVASYVVPSCWVVSSKNRAKGPIGQSRITFVGLGPDPETARATFVQLRDSLISQCTARYGQAVRGEGRSYAVGFVSGLFVAAREAAQAETNVEEVKAALIRTDMLTTRSRDWYLAQKEGIRLRSASNRIGGLDSDAFSRGREDGMVADRSKRHPISGRLN